MFNPNRLVLCLTLPLMLALGLIGLLVVPLAYADGPVALDPVAGWSSNDSDFTVDVAWGDMDGDGDLDLAVANNAGNHKVYLNDHGLLQTEPVWTALDGAGSNSWAIAWGDVNGDGYLDLAVGNYGRNRVYFNQGGVLQNFSDWFSADTDLTNDVAWGDINNDGYLDLVVANQRNNGQQGQDKIYFNIGGTLVATGTAFSPDNEDSLSLALGDMDRDGDLDVAVGNANFISQNQILGAPNKIYRNVNGVIQPTPVWTSTEADLTFDLAWGDLNGDGYLDLAAGNGRRLNLFQFPAPTGSILTTMAPCPARPPGPAPKIWIPPLFRWVM